MKVTLKRRFITVSPRFFIYRMSVTSNSTTFFSIPAAQDAAQYKTLTFDDCEFLVRWKCMIVCIYQRDIETYPPTKKNLLSIMQRKQLINVDIAL